MRFVTALLPLPLLCACAALPPPAPIEFLDERTAVTVTVVDTPWLFARERRDVAVNARDYLTLVPVERNQAGRYSLALVVHAWSTIDTRVAGAPTAPGLPLVFVVDGRDLRLQRVDPPPRELSDSSGRLWEPDSSYRTTSVYAIDRQMLRLLASSREVYAFFEGAADDPPYVEWRDGRTPLLRLLDRTEHSASAAR